MEYFQTHNINHLPFESKYKSQVATQYCEMLKSQVLENLTIQAITTLEDPVPMDHFSVECTFWEGPIGMTLVKDESCRAVVAKLVANGPAEKKGVCIGDIVGSIRGQSFLTYEELMDLILLLPRPIQIQFLRLQVDDSDHLEPISEHRHKSLSISGCDAPLLNETVGGNLCCLIIIISSEVLILTLIRHYLFLDHIRPLDTLLPSLPPLFLQSHCLHLPLHCPHLLSQS